jgi:hypothetical protein
MLEQFRKGLWSMSSSRSVSAQGRGSGFWREGKQLAVVNTQKMGGSK